MGWFQIALPIFMVFSGIVGVAAGVYEGIRQRREMKHKKEKPWGFWKT